jgi:polyvinyl alcohol dehydrogenase (cytochrome)
MKRSEINRRHLIAGGAALTGAAAIGLAGSTFAQDATPIPGGAPSEGSPAATPATPVPQEPIRVAEWPFYGNGVEGTKFTDASGITAGNVANLQLAWTGTVGGPISSTPVIAEGLVAVGSYDGKLRAYDPDTGEEIWALETGAAVMEPNLHIPLGITGSAAIDNGVVYTGDATGKLWAVNAATGETIWSAEPDAQSAASIWSSPVVADGVLYVGIASVAKETGFRGAVVAVDVGTGEMIWDTYVTPEGSDGGGVFAVPALDRERGILYVGTQNAYSADVSPDSHVLSIIALKMETGEVVWSFSGVPSDGSATAADDIGFSASPNLFSIEPEHGVTRELVGNGQKSGIYWALDRDSGEVVWSTPISSAGPLGGMEGTSAVGNGVIVVPATEWASFDNPEARGVVRGLKAATGEIIWTHDSAAPNPAPVAVANDVAFQAGFDGLLHAFALATGEELWSYDLGASVSGGIAIAGDLVVVGASTPAFAPFIKEGDKVWAFRLVSPPIQPATPIASPVPATPEMPAETPTPAGSPEATPASS